MRRLVVAAIACSLLAAAARAEEPPSGVVGYDRGLYVSVGPLRLTLNGAVQGRYVYEWARGGDGASGFDLHHAVLATTATLTRWVTARVALDFSSNYYPAIPWAQPSGILRDAWIDVEPLGWLRLRVGQFLIPFGRQRLTSSTALAGTERSIATLAFASNRDFGVMLSASPWDGRLLVEAAVTDGEAGGTSITGQNANFDLRYTGRVLAAPLGPVPLVEGDPSARGDFRFSVGGAGSWDLVPTDDPINPDRSGTGRRDNVAVLSFDGEVAAAWRRLSLQAEYFRRREHYGAALPDRDYSGFHAQAQLVVVRGWAMLAARVAYAEPHRLGVPAATSGPPGSYRLNALFDITIPDSAWELGAGAVGFYSYGAAQLVKLQVGYSFRRHQYTLGSSDAQLVELQLTAMF